MKKLLITLGLIAGVVGTGAVCMTSCGDFGDSTATFTVSKYYEKDGFTKIKESKDSDKIVYFTTVTLRNRTGSTQEINSSDFKLKVDGSEYSCLYFIESRKYESTSDNFGSESTYYIDSKTNTKSVEDADKGNVISLENADLAFEVNPNGKEFEMYFKGSLIKGLGE